MDRSEWEQPPAFQPRTIYKQRKIDRDNVVDIGFDAVKWMDDQIRLILSEKLFVELNTLEENNMNSTSGFTLVVSAPDCPTCGASQQGRHYLQFNELDVVLLLKAGMHVGHPATFWDQLPVEEATKELYRLKAAMLKKPLEYMMLARQSQRDYGQYERLIFRIDDFILNAPKTKDGVVKVEG